MEFVKAAKITQQLGVDARFLVVGANARNLSGLKGWVLEAFGFAQDMERDLRAYVDSNRLNNVEFLGFVESTAEVYRNIDVLCFPSKLNAAGRPVLEAAYFGVPSIVAARNPKPDTIVPGVSGLCIVESDPVELANAIKRLFLNASLRERLGQGAQCLARRYFDPKENAKKVLSVYQRVVEVR